MPIGRLDQKSEGLLLLTSDGKLSHLINSSGIEKEYYALVDGIISESDLNKLSKGVSINVHGKAYTTKPCKVSIVTTIEAFPLADRKERDQRHGPTSWISITLTEGKFRQVRKMTSAIGFPTLRLVRVRVGNVTLDLPVGTAKPIDLSDFIS